MNLRPLPKALQVKAEMELNEVPAQMEENLKMLRSWLSKQEHLKYKNEDQFLVNMLRCSKYSLERAKEKLDNYYTFRTLVPELGKNLDPLLPNIQYILNSGMVCPLPIPKDDPASPLVYINRYTDYDPNEIRAVDFTKYQIIVNEIFLNINDNFVVGGVIVIVDLKNMQYKTAVQTTLTLIKQTMHGLVKANPARFKGIYLINMPVFCEPLYNVGKRFLSKKISKRLFVYSSNNLEEFYKHIPKSILPTEYGGTAGPMNDIAENWKQTVESCREMLLEEDNYYSDESKRPGTPYTVESVFGIEGSFRKLDID